MFIDDDQTDLQPPDDSEGTQPFTPDERTLDPKELSQEFTNESDRETQRQEPTVVESAYAEGGPSDVELAAEDTLAAPSFPQPLQDKRLSSAPRELSLEPGDELGDFEVLEVLGRGAFGVVYLARQMSLDRRVALKVAANEGSEGRTMARLEHDHIVQVFSEDVDATGCFRLLCMQLVPGSSLDAVIRDLHREANQQQDAGPHHWSGADYLASVDEATCVSDTFDPSALRDRELIASGCEVEVSAWVGARLAEAINFAHANGVLHRDIKPANVLIDQYGRPMLADFNIAFRAATGSGEGDRDSSFGGTLAFMAPEHLEAFDPRGEATAADVDERSDIYSLAIVIYQLLCGDSPFEDPRRDVSRTRYVGLLAKWRREAPAPIEAGPPSARKVLQHTLAKSLASEKEARYQTGEQFAAALDGCQSLADVERQTPATGLFASAVLRRPLLWAMLLIFLPQVLGSVVNISYNKYQIVGLLTEAQQTLFVQLVTWYNALVYPAAFATLVYFFRPVFQQWKALEGNARLDARQVDAVRRASLRLPIWVLIAAAVGWLPGGLIFPTLLHWIEGPIDSHVFSHFVTSFAFSGLLAVAYSFAGMQYVVLRVLYPRLWTDATDFWTTARKELAGTGWRLLFIEFTALLIPFLAMMLFALVTREGGAIPLSSLIFSVALAGLAGFPIVRVATGAMAATQTALVGRA